MSDKPAIGKIEPELHMPDIHCDYCEEKDQRIAELKATIADNECVWIEADDGWYTDCGNCFVINDGTAYENSMKYCCYCGGRLREKDDE